METLAKVFVLIVSSIALLILGGTVYCLNKLLPNVYWTWWALLGPISIVLSFLVSIGIVKLILYSKRKRN